jgi:hypothetical protein
MKIIKQVENVELSFDERKIIKTLDHIHSSDESLSINIPLDIKYNEEWSIRHDVDCEECSIGFSRYHKENWQFISRLFSRYYHEELLEVFGKCFDSLHVFESEKSKYTFLTKADFNDDKAPIYAIPQVNFNYYKCEKCNTQFLCRFSEGLPRDPDSRIPKGMEGRLLIHEIVQFEMEDDIEFLDYLESFAKEV